MYNVWGEGTGAKCSLRDTLEKCYSVWHIVCYCVYWRNQPPQILSHVIEMLNLGVKDKNAYDRIQPLPWIHPSCQWHRDWCLSSARQPCPELNKHMFTKYKNLQSQGAFLKKLKKLNRVKAKRTRLLQLANVKVTQGPCVQCVHVQCVHCVYCFKLIYSNSHVLPFQVNFFKHI